MSCTEAQKRAYREYYKRNREKERKRFLVYYANNREEIITERRKRYKEDFERSDKLRKYMREYQRAKRRKQNEESKTVNTDTSV